MALEVFAQLETHLLLDLAVVIVFAAIIAFLARLLKQPLIFGYIIAGIILGPQMLGLIQGEALILELSEIGIAFLLFFVGLEMQVKKLREVGLVASLGTLVQVAITFVVGYTVAGLLGFDTTVATILGLVLSFSSTSIVVKLLADKDEINTLHGRIAMGMLLMQDILVIFVLAGFGSLSNFSPNVLYSAVFRGIALLVFAIFVAKLFLPRLFDYAAKYQELLLLFSLTIFFFFSAFAAYLDFPIVVGAFVAGVALASLPYSAQIIGMVKPLKDFFVTIFFVSLGMQLYLGGTVRDLLWPLILFAFIVVLIKPFIIMFLCFLFGYERRTSFLTGFSLGQVSEFSLILAVLALHLEMITKDVFSLIVLLVAVTMVITVYFFAVEKPLYRRISSLLMVFEKFSLTKQAADSPMRGKHDIVLVGCGTMGSILVNALKKSQKKLLAIDFNPSVIKHLVLEKISCVYGDIANEEILHKANVNKAEVIISTVPDPEDNKCLIGHVKEHNEKVKVIVVAHRLNQALDLYETGADYVLVPRVESGENIPELIANLLKSKRVMEKMRRDHVKHIIQLEKFNYALMGKDQ